MLLKNENANLKCLSVKVKDGEKLETPVGYTWIPIIERGTLATGEHNLPVTSELPQTPGYSFISTDRAPPGIKFLIFVDFFC